MAVHTLYITNVAANTTGNFFSILQDGGTAPSATNSSYGWGVAKSAVTTQGFWPAHLGATGTLASSGAQATSSIDSDTSPTKGTGATSTTAGDSFVAGPFTGTFAATNWQLDYQMRADTAGAKGQIRCRVWKSVNADGTSATELTSGALVGTNVTLSASGDTNSGITWSPGALVFTNEYIFFQIEWQETVAGTSASDNVKFRVGTALITTPDLGTGTPFIRLRMKYLARR